MPSSAPVRPVDVFDDLMLSTCFSPFGSHGHRGGPRGIPGEVILRQPPERRALLAELRSDDLALPHFPLAYLDEGGPPRWTRGIEAQVVAFDRAVIGARKAPWLP